MKMISFISSVFILENKTAYSSAQEGIAAFIISYDTTCLLSPSLRDANLGNYMQSSILLNDGFVSQTEVTLEISLLN